MTRIIIKLPTIGTISWEHVPNRSKENTHFSGFPGLFCFDAFCILVYKQIPRCVPYPPVLTGGKNITKIEYQFKHPNPVSPRQCHDFFIITKLIIKLLFLFKAVITKLTS